MNKKQQNNYITRGVIVVGDEFSNLQRDESKQAFKRWLKDWKMWKLKSMRNFPGMASPSMDGQPNDGTPHDPDQKFVNHAEAEYQWRVRINCCKSLMTIGEREEILGDILLHRFIKNESPVKTLCYINEHYNQYIDDRSFRRLQDEALWEGVIMCPDDSVRIRK